MNFQTFTGNARKRRNVNLSGQRPTNLFATPSQSVESALAERQQRQRAKDRTQWASRLQRIWRGISERQMLRDAWRRQIDELYRSDDEPHQRLATAIPVILFACDASDGQDRDRLALVVRDVLRTRFESFKQKDFSRRLEKLAGLLVAVLEELYLLDGPSNEAHVRIFLQALHELPQVVALRRHLGRYYTLLGRHGRLSGRTDATLQQLLRHMAARPLVTCVDVPADFTKEAYKEFAFYFLAQSELQIDDGVPSFSMERLCEALIAAPSSKLDFDGRLTLLANLITLYQSSPASTSAKIRTTTTIQYIHALFLQLSGLAIPIRRAFSAVASLAKTQAGIHPSVREALLSSIGEGQLSGLLGNLSTPLEKSQITIVLGYLLLSIYCFPKQADDIRMQLLAANMSPKVAKRTEHPTAFVQFCWYEMEGSMAFQQIRLGESQTLELFKNRENWGDMDWNREWRTILLFLEVYSFYLSVTDDADFFAGLDGDVSDAPSRGRMSKQHLALLTKFLKHLGFALCYHADTILTWEAKRLDTLEGPGAAPLAGKVDPNPQLSFRIIPGFDFGAFKSLVTSVTGMLYERDSQRQFLPQDHWLVSSDLEMNQFRLAVMLEEKKRQEKEEEEEDDDDDDDDDDAESDAAENAIDGDGGVRVSAAGLRLARNAKIEWLQAQQKKASCEKRMATAASQLETLRNMPFVIPFDVRVQLFRDFVLFDKTRRRGAHVDSDLWRQSVLHSPNGRDRLRKQTALIRRGSEFVDATDKLWSLGEGLKEPIQITFVDHFGMVEAGIDGGGVTKEFIHSVVASALKDRAEDQPGLLAGNRENALYPNPCAFDQLTEIDKGQQASAALAKDYEFLGRVIGKSLYEGILIDTSFAGFFLRRWAVPDDKYRPTVNDLRELDEDLYRSLMQLKKYPGNVAELGLEFVITDQSSLPGQPMRTITRDLFYDGSGGGTLLTSQNIYMYIKLVTRHRLYVQSFRQTRAFLRGLWSIIEPTWLRMFNQSELQRLVGGDHSEIDVEDWRRHTVYDNLYETSTDGEEHATIKMFWEVMGEMDDKDRREVLRFVTSSPRAPLQGFTQLRPRFSIRYGGPDETRLPSASTCFNLLKLPRYSSKEVLRNKIMYAIKSKAGFNLS